MALHRGDWSITYDSDSHERIGGRTWIIACIALIGVTIAALLIAYIALNSVPTVAEPRIDQDFTDRNQTRAELVDIIQKQRAAVYSSYILEYAFCDSRMDEVKESIRSDVRVEGPVTKVSVHCTGMDGNTTTYLLEFDQVANKYKESIKLQLPNS